MTTTELTAQSAMVEDTAMFQGQTGAWAMYLMTQPLSSDHNSRETGAEGDESPVLAA